MTGAPDTAVSDLIRVWLDLQAEAERPFARFDGAVPPADSDPGALWAGPVEAPDGPREEGPFDDFGAKARNLARALAGQPQILLTHASLVVLLRRRAPPDHAADLFNRIWSHDPARLVGALDPRWRISAAETFADHGATEAQRRTGLSLAILCKTVKIYETERLFSGVEPTELFRGSAKSGPLALDQAALRLAQGDIDRALLTRILRGADGDPVAAALAWSLIPDLVGDERGVFHRLRRMRARRQQRTA